MTKRLLVSSFALVLMTGAAFAQSMPSDPTANFPNGPAGRETMTKTQRTVNPDGTVTQQSQSYDKTQSYTSGAGALSAHSTVQTNERTTVVPPVPTTSSTTTTTTTEQVR